MKNILDYFFKEDKEEEKILEGKLKKKTLFEDNETDIDNIDENKLLNGRYELKNLMKKTKEYYNPIFQDNEDIEIILEKKIVPNRLSGNNNYYDPSRMRTSTKIKGEKIFQKIHFSFNDNILTELTFKKWFRKYEKNKKGHYSIMSEKKDRQLNFIDLSSQSGGCDLIFKNSNQLVLVFIEYLDSSYLFCYDVYYGKYKIRNKFIYFYNFDIYFVY
jgi:hypothetical protein